MMEYHFLQKEIPSELIEFWKNDTSIQQFIQHSSSEYIGFWELSNISNQWMSSGFWKTLGYTTIPIPKIEDCCLPDIFLKINNRFLENRYNADFQLDEKVCFKDVKGEFRTFQVHAKPFVNEDSKNVYILAILREVNCFSSLSNDSKKELERLKKLLHSKEKELERYSYISSHDLHEPLDTIQSFVTLIQKFNAHQLDEIAEQSLKVIEESTVKMKEFITTLYTYCKIGSEVEIEQTSLEVIYENIKQKLKELSAPKNYRLELKGANIEVNAIKGSIQNILYQLIENALRFTLAEEVPQVIVNAKENHDHYFFSIFDNGIGIAPKYHDIIFNLFQKLHTCEQYQGLGMGLSKCKKYVELHHGEIWLDSEEGKGSKFYFTIPKNLGDDTQCSID